MNNFFDIASGKQCPTTEPLSESDLSNSNLLQGLVELHRIAYAWLGDAHLDIHNLIQRMGNQPLRTRIRAALEALDIAYVHQEIITPKPTILVEGSVAEDAGFFREDGNE